MVLIILIVYLAILVILEYINHKMDNAYVLLIIMIMGLNNAIIVIKHVIPVMELKTIIAHHVLVIIIEIYLQY